MSTMSLVLFVWGLLSFLSGVMSLVFAKSAIHQAVGGLAFVVGTVAWGAVGIIEEIRKLRRELPKGRGTEESVEGEATRDAASEDSPTTQEDVVIGARVYVMFAILVVLVAVAFLASR